MLFGSDKLLQCLFDPSLVERAVVAEMTRDSNCITLRINYDRSISRLEDNPLVLRYIRRFVPHKMAYRISVEVDFTEVLDTGVERLGEERVNQFWVAAHAAVCAYDDAKNLEKAEAAHKLLEQSEIVTTEPATC